MCLNRIDDHPRYVFGSPVRLEFVIRILVLLLLRIAIRQMRHQLIFLVDLLEHAVDEGEPCSERSFESPRNQSFLGRGLVRIDDIWALCEDELRYISILLAEALSHVGEGLLVVVEAVHAEYAQFIRALSALHSK